MINAPGMLTVRCHLCIEGLGAMLGTAMEEQLHEVLAALAAVVHHSHTWETADAQSAIIPGVMAVWERNVTDPLVSVSALDLLQALAGISECRAGLQVCCPHLNICTEPHATQVQCCQLPALAHGMIQEMVPASTGATCPTSP